VRLHGAYFPYREIADVLRLEEANTRQLVTRARQRVAGDLPATRYSYRKAIIGSTRLARRAGW